MILPLFYFGPISYFSFLHRNCNENLLFEVHENFVKQTYRNRCYVLGSNQKIALTIPILHKNSNRKFKDTKICYHFNWNKLHLKTLESAYRSAPYFEYYEEPLTVLYDKREVFLIDFLTYSFEWIIKSCNLNLNFKTTESYTKGEPELDFRYSFSFKKSIEKEENLLKYTKEYYQVLSKDQIFTKNLSILDLIFNCGNTSVSYL